MDALRDEFGLILNGALRGIITPVHYAGALSDRMRVPALLGPHGMTWITSLDCLPYLWHYIHHQLGHVLAPGQGVHHIVLVGRELQQKERQAGGHSGRQVGTQEGRWALRKAGGQELRWAGRSQGGEGSDVGGHQRQMTICMNMMFNSCMTEAINPITMVYQQHKTRLTLGASLTLGRSFSQLTQLQSRSTDPHKP